MLKSLNLCPFLKEKNIQNNVEGYLLEYVRDKSYLEFEVAT